MPPPQVGPCSMEAHQHRCVVPRGSTPARFAVRPSAISSEPTAISSLARCALRCFSLHHHHHHPNALTMPCRTSFVGLARFIPPLSAPSARLSSPPKDLTAAPSSPPPPLLLSSLPLLSQSERAPKPRPAGLHRGGRRIERVVPRSRVEAGLRGCELRRRAPADGGGLARHAGKEPGGRT